MAAAESPVEPDAVIVYGPLATLATINDPDNTPPETEQLGEVTALLANEQDVSLSENPEPVTWTVPPTAAIVGLTAMDMGNRVSVKVADAASPPGLPVTVIV